MMNNDEIGKATARIIRKIEKSNQRPHISKIQDELKLKGWDISGDELLELLEEMKYKGILQPFEISRYAGNTYSIEPGIKLSPSYRIAIDRTVEQI